MQNDHKVMHDDKEINEVMQKDYEETQNYLCMTLDCLEL